MKYAKLFFSIFAVLFIFSGCKNSYEPATVNFRSIAFTADVVCDGRNYLFDCSIDKTGNFSVTILAPDSVKGLSAEFSGDSCDMQFNGIKIDGSDAFLPYSSSVFLIYRVIKVCDGAVPAKTKRNLNFTGNVGGNKFTLKASPSGLPISLELPDLYTSVAFKNVMLSNI